GSAFQNKNPVRIRPNHVLKTGNKASRCISSGKHPSYLSFFIQFISSCPGTCGSRFILCVKKRIAHGLQRLFPGNSFFLKFIGYL
ncbi:MAG TPA: hypothetical protein DDW86_02885, partial [Clostridiales bacterium]|nr:hypothetical protein [Clostridiales bacterium]